MYPDGRIKSIGFGTIEKWLYEYRHGGIEALQVHRRRDAGSFRGIDEDLAGVIDDILQDHPKLRTHAIIAHLECRGLPAKLPNGRTRRQQTYLIAIPGGCSCTGTTPVTAGPTCWTAKPTANEVGIAPTRKETSNMLENTQTFFGLTDPAFCRPPRKPYLDPARQRALAQLQALVRRRGFAVLTGPPGSGKTALIHYLCNQLNDNQHQVAYVPFSFLEKGHMLNYLAAQLGLEPCRGLAATLRLIQTSDCHRCRANTPTRTSGTISAVPAAVTTSSSRPPANSSTNWSTDCQGSSTLLPKSPWTRPQAVSTAPSPSNTSTRRPKQSCRRRSRR